MKPNYRNIVQKGDEIYLCVNGEWFFYNQTEPPLGAGAMGTVYLGRSCQTQERVAIKRVVDKYANVPSIRERAKLEASLLFRHRNLVEMIGYCELNPYNGPIFIVSRLVQGITLDEHVNTHLRNRKDAVKRICESLYPVMDALDYLHQKGIVHMDIKPANIMIEHGSNIRLMDLGIAYTPDSVSMTSPGLIGTPKYAAPEQIIEPGQVQLTVDKTTDIYELGVTLYELLPVIILLILLQGRRLYKGSEWKYCRIYREYRKRLWMCFAKRQKNSKTNVSNHRESLRWRYKRL